MKTFETLVKKLIENKMKIAAAESCTAGLFSSFLASVPGASEIMEYGFVVYSERAKIDVLGVPSEIIEENGVVSEKTAEFMADGAAKRAGADVSVGITGFAGPSSDAGYPVGRVCFGFYYNGKTEALTKEFGDIGRNAVREKAAIFAAEKILELFF
ncbi:MAG: CinA family protein [Oscillospiraceae bacterium]|nr:CinA family protein [Oscillospiraceae bacterium]